MSSLWDRSPEARTLSRWYLSFSVSWLWIPLIGLNDATLFALLQQHPVVAEAGRITLFGCLGVGLLGISLLRDRLSRPLDRAWAPLVAGAVLAVGALVSGLAGIGVLPVGLFIAGGAIKGAAASALLMCWIQRFRADYTGRASIVLVGSIILAAGATCALLLSSNIAEVLTLVLLVCLPISVLALPGSIKQQPAAIPTVQHGRYGTPRLLIGVSALYGAGFGLVLDVTMSAASGAPTATALLAIGATVLAYVLAGLMVIFWTSAVLRRVLLACVTLLSCLLLLSLFGLGQYYLVNVTITAGWAGAIIVMMMICAGLAGRFRAPVLAFGGQMGASSALASAITMLVLPTAGIQVSVGLPWLLAIIFVSVSALLLASAFLPGDRGVVPLWGFASALAEQKLDLTLERQCADAAKAYSLTPREEEILVLLAKGRNSDHIAQKLVLSPFTVKTHMRRIYAKMGVHDHQALIDIVEGRPAGDSAP